MYDCVLCDYDIVPQLVSFDFDQRFGQFTLYFTDLVAANSFDITKTTVQATKNLTEFEYVLTFADGLYETSLASEGNTSTLIYHITTHDYAKLMYNYTAGSTANTTYLTLGENAVTSPWAEPNIIVNSSDAMRVSNFIRDTVPPFVVDFSIDMNSAQVNMTINEPLLPSSFTTVPMRIMGWEYMSRRWPLLWVCCSARAL